LPASACAHLCMQVKVRYVPQSLGASPFFSTFTGYPVKAILPDAFLKRRNNKGLENAAVSPDGKVAWTMIQVGTGWLARWRWGWLGERAGKVGLLVALPSRHQ